MQIICDAGFRELAGLATPHEKVERLQDALLEFPQVDLQTKHHLSGGVYTREIFIPAGCTLTGATHKKDHINIVWGDITVTTDEGPKRLTGWHVLPTKAGSKRAGYAHADTYWATVSETELTDIEAIEDELVVESHMLQTRTLALARDKTEQLET